jgi:hypothetical protein
VIEEAAMRSATVAALLAAGIFVPPAMAQPQRQGNVWGGAAHQPAAGSVQSDEHAAGIAPTDSQLQREDQDLAQINREVLQRALRETPGTVGSGR